MSGLWPLSYTGPFEKSEGPSMIKRKELENVVSEAVGILLKATEPELGGEEENLKRLIRLKMAELIKLEARLGL